MWRPPAALLAAMATPTDTPLHIHSHFNTADPLLGCLAPCMDTTLVLISQIYVDKLMTDAKSEELLLGGAAGSRASLECVVHDFFVSRFGVRAASELHIAGFLAAVKRYREQHPKIRVFARLLGLQDPDPNAAATGANPHPAAGVASAAGAGNPNAGAAGGGGGGGGARARDRKATTAGGGLQVPEERVFIELAMPPGAVDFYCALLNRLHARAGPLIMEAAEGYSLLQAKVLHKVAREFVRGAFGGMPDYVAQTSDLIRAMALNDDEKPIDAERALEAMLRAYVAQYWADHAALSSLFRGAYENVGRKLITPDDLAGFLRQLNADKASSLAPSSLLNMYTSAMRSSGPNNEQLGKAVCAAILDSGFVGISSHHSRHESMKSLPPYDEFRLLEESWQGLKPGVEHQVGVLQRNTTSVRADLPTYLDLARRVEELVGARDSVAAAWSTYRRLLAVFCSHRAAVEALEPFKGRPISAASSLFSRGTGVGDGGSVGADPSTQPGTSMSSAGNAAAGVHASPAESRAGTPIQAVQGARSTARTVNVSLGGVLKKPVSQDASSSTPTGQPAGSTSMRGGVLSAAASAALQGELSLSTGLVPGSPPTPGTSSPLRSRGGLLGQKGGISSGVLDGGGGGGSPATHSLQASPRPEAHGVDGVDGVDEGKEPEV